MTTTVTLPAVENDTLRARFSFPERDLRTYHYALRYYPRDMKVRGGKMTMRQEEACHDLTCRLDKEIVRICEFIPPEGSPVGSVAFSIEDAHLLEDALRFLGNQIKSTASLCVAALDRFHQETSLLLAVLAAEEQ